MTIYLYNRLSNQLLYFINQTTIDDLYNWFNHKNSQMFNTKTFFIIPLIYSNIK